MTPTPSLIAASISLPLPARRALAEQEGPGFSGATAAECALRRWGAL
jgi:hypothetical protein